MRQFPGKYRVHESTVYHDTSITFEARDLKLQREATTEERA